LRETRSGDVRGRVAREAAELLYTGQEKEYRQAKVRAARILGVRFLPSNREVAEELDRIADEEEGPARRERLVEMRREALGIMEVLRDLHPRLEGSVWRGTAHQNSDIDIAAFSPSPEDVLTLLQERGFRVTKAEWCSVTKGGRAVASFHIHLALPSGHEAEVVVSRPEERDVLRRCGIYGDLITGLDCSQLRRVLEENPLQRLVPKKTS